MLNKYESTRKLMAASVPVVKKVNQAVRKKARAAEPQLPLVETNTIPSPEGLVTTEELGEILKQASESRDRRANEFGVETNAAILKEAVKSVHSATEDVAALSAKFKGAYEAGLSEERLAWFVVIQNVVDLAEGFKAFTKGKTLPIQKRKKHSTGRELAHVFPSSTYEHTLFPGYSTEVWFPVGEEPYQKTFDDLPKPEVAVLLASGNQTPQVGGDILHVVFVENSICVCKLNPVNDYLLPALQKAFKPLIDNGLLYLVNGGIDVSSALIWAREVQSLHMTGSDKTYDMIMWGPTPQGFIDSLPDFCEKPELREAPNGDRKAYIAKRKAEGGKPNLSKPFAAELGNVTPVIIVPGEWSKKAIAYHAKNLVATKVNNAGFNCLSPQLIITDARWPQREEFLEAIRNEFKVTNPRAAYYPGAGGRREQFLEKYEGEADIYYEHGEQKEGVLPWTLISGIDSENFTSESLAACSELFSGVLTEIPIKLEPTDELLAKDFLPAAVTLCNDSVWGTLTACIFVPPKVQKKLPGAVEEALADLRYGSISVNAPTIICYAFIRATWGGFGGDAPPTDIQSGNGFVHNTMMFKNAEKTIVRCPFGASYTPVWFHDNRNIDAISKKLVDFWVHKTAANWTSLLASGLRG